MHEPFGDNIYQIPTDNNRGTAALDYRRNSKIEQLNHQKLNCNFEQKIIYSEIIFADKISVSNLYLMW